MDQQEETGIEGVLRIIFEREGRDGLASLALVRGPVTGELKLVIDDEDVDTAVSYALTGDDAADLAVVLLRTIGAAGTIQKDHGNSVSWSLLGKPLPRSTEHHTVVGELPASPHDPDAHPADFRLPRHHDINVTDTR